MTAMTRRPVRLAPALYKVLKVIAHSPDTAPAWPTNIRERTGLGPDAIYTALDKMTMAGWVVAEKQPAGCTPHRVYRLTPAGRERWEEAVKAEALPSRLRMLLDRLTSGHKGRGEYDHR